MFRFARSLSRTVHAIPSYKTIMKGAVFVGAVAVLWLFFGFSLTTASLLSFIAYLATGGWRFAEVVINTLPRDLKYVCSVSVANVLMTVICYKIKSAKDSVQGKGGKTKGLLDRLN